LGCRYGRSFKAQVVEDISSIVGEADEERISLHADHMNMCKFKDKQDSDYYLVLDVIQRWIRDIETIQVPKDAVETRADVIASM